MIPYQITCRNVPLNPGLRNFVRGYVRKLKSFYPQILRCQVTLSVPHRRHRRGQCYHVMVRAEVAGPDLVVSREAELDPAHENLALSIHDAFRALERQLEDQIRERRGYVKLLERLPRARVSRVFLDRDFGFLETDDGSEVYFHKNSVKRGRFDQLRPGDEVRFHLGKGIEGPQASVVRLVR